MYPACLFIITRKRGVGMPAITEKQVLGIWQDILRGGADLKTVDNESVRVIYPGRRNDDRGADFKDAIITTNRG